MSGVLSRKIRIMYLIYRFFNSVIFAIVNATIVLYICQRIFRAMREHYRIMGEAERFNMIIFESRATLDYIGSQVSAGMVQMKEDIAKELLITDYLTKLSSKVALSLQRYSELEEAMIELVRMEHNMKSVRIETPADINDEVRNVLTAARKKQPSQSDRPRTPKKLWTTTATKEPLPQSHHPTARYVTSQPCKPADLSNVTMSEKQERPRTPVYPEVRLLNDVRPVTDEKPIGFRPTWKCEA